MYGAISLTFRTRYGAYIHTTSTGDINHLLLDVVVEGGGRVIDLSARFLFRDGGALRPAVKPAGACPHAVKPASLRPRSRQREHGGARRFPKVLSLRVAPAIAGLAVR